MKSIESIMKASYGTAKEMQLRMLLHDIRKAADKGKCGVAIPKHKISHMPELTHEILEPAGFKTSEFVEVSWVKKWYISWQ